MRPGPEPSTELTTVAAATENAAASFFWLLIAHGLSVAWGAFGSIYLARTLTPGPYGLLRFAQTIAGYLLVVADNGLRPSGVREVAAFPGLEAVRGVLLLRVVVGSVLAMACIVVVAIGWSQSQVGVLLSLAALVLLPASANLGWAFQGVQRTIFVTLAEGVFAVTYVGAMVLLVHHPRDVVVVPVIELAAHSVGSMLLLLTLGPVLRRLPQVHWTRGSGFYSGAVTLGAAGALGFLLNQCDLLILGVIDSAHVVGLYSAASRLVVPFLGIAAYAGMALLPTLLKDQTQNTDAGMTIIRLFWGVIGILALPATIGLSVLADGLVILIYGVAYAASAPALAVLSWVILVGLVQVPFWCVLTARRRDREQLGAVAVAAVCDVLLNLLLIPPLGMMGSALASVASWLVLMLVLYLRARSFVHVSLWPYLVRPGGAAALMGLVLVLLKDNLVLAVLTGSIVYIGAVWVTRAFNPLLSAWRELDATSRGNALSPWLPVVHGFRSRK